MATELNHWTQGTPRPSIAMSRMSDLPAFLAPIIAELEACFAAAFDRAAKERTMPRVASLGRERAYPWGVAVRNHHYEDSVAVPHGATDAAPYRPTMQRLARMAALHPETLATGIGPCFWQDRAPPRLSWVDYAGSVYGAVDLRGALVALPVGQELPADEAPVT